MATSEVSQINEVIEECQKRCPKLGILVVGLTGVGKSTLVNNLLGKEVASEGDSVKPETAIVTMYEREIKNVSVVVYDTPGLGESEDRDKEHLSQIAKVVENDEIHVVIYCFNMAQIRFGRNVTRTFQEYKKVGIDWGKTVFALTFADGLTPPSKLTKARGFSKAKYFEGRLQEWKEVIIDVLAKEVGLDKKDLSAQIRINPTIDDPKKKLPNGKFWFVPLWVEMAEILPACAMMRFFDIHKNNPAVYIESPEVKAQFKAVVGKKMHEEITGWGVVKTVAEVAVLGAAVSVTVPLIVVAAVAALPVVTVGAAIAGFYKLFFKKK